MAAHVAALDLDAVLAHPRSVVAPQARRAGGEAAAGTFVQRYRFETDATLGDAPGSHWEMRLWLVRRRQRTDSVLAASAAITVHDSVVVLEARLEETQHLSQESVVVDHVGRGVVVRRRRLLQRSAGVVAVAATVMVAVMVTTRCVRLRVRIGVITTQLRALGSERQEKTLENEAKLFQVGSPGGPLQASWVGRSGGRRRWRGRLHRHFAGERLLGVSRSPEAVADCRRPCIPLEVSRRRRHMRGSHLTRDALQRPEYM